MAETKDEGVFMTAGDLMADLGITWSGGPGRGAEMLDLELRRAISETDATLAYRGVLDTVLYSRKNYDPVWVGQYGVEWARPKTLEIVRRLNAEAVEQNAIAAQRERDEYEYIRRTTGVMPLPGSCMIPRLALYVIPEQ